MTNNIRHELNEKIEKLRKTLYNIVDDLGFNHPEVVEASQMLDELLNELQRIDQDERPKKHLRIENILGVYRVVIDHGDISYVLSEWATLDQAIKSAKRVSNESNRPKMHVYLRGKKI